MRTCDKCEWGRGGGIRGLYCFIDPPVVLSMGDIDRGVSSSRRPLVQKEDGCKRWEAKVNG